jgi:hypothetical protein
MQWLRKLWGIDLLTLQHSIQKPADVAAYIDLLTHTAAY